MVRISRNVFFPLKAKDCSLFVLVYLHFLSICKMRWCLNSNKSNLIFLSSSFFAEEGYTFQKLYEVEVELESTDKNSIK